MTVACVSPQGVRGRRLMTSRPLASALLLAASTPTTTTERTAGSRSTTCAAAPCSADMRSNDTSGAACSRPCS